MILVKDSQGAWHEVTPAQQEVFSVWHGTEAELEAALPSLAEGTAVFVTDD